MSVTHDTLRALRVALNRTDGEALLHYAKAMTREAMLYPSTVDFAALRTVQLLLHEAMQHEPR